MVPLRVHREWLLFGAEVTTNAGHPAVMQITGFINLCPQYRRCFKGEVQDCGTMDFSFVGQSSDRKAVGHLTLILFSVLEGKWFSYV